LLGLIDAAEHDFVNQLFSEPGPYWTGGNDISTEGDYEWVNGEEWTYEAWEPGEPTDDTNVNVDEDCINLYDNAVEGPLFGDDPCGNTQKYVCERYPPE
jgi:hypothetical protein